MGLDTVELVMELEDRFQLAIPDAEAARITTVGATEDYIVARLRERAGEAGAACPSAHRFYSLRRELLGRFPVSRNQVRPQPSVGAVLPCRRWRREWGAIARAVGLPLPRRTFFAPRFPPPGATLREIVEQTFAVPYLHSDGAVDEPRVRELVRLAVAEQAGVSVDSLHLGTRYVQDLGLD